jgi:hypothetical protein
MCGSSTACDRRFDDLFSLANMLSFMYLVLLFKLFSDIPCCGCLRSKRAYLAIHIVLIAELQTFSSALAEV